MEFHEILNKLMDEHNLRAVDLCSGTGLNRAYISKVRSGQLLPADYQVVADISDTMQLSTEERTELTEAYQAKKTSVGRGLAWKTFNNLYRLKYSGSESVNSIEITDLKNGDVISGYDRLIQAAVELVGGEKQKLKIILIPISDELRKFTENTFSALSDSAEIEWLIPMDNTESISELNMTAFVNTLYILLGHSADVKELKTDLDSFMHSSLFPFIIVADSGVLLIDENVENGMYLDSADSISLYQNKFTELAGTAVPFLRTYNSAESFLMDMAYMALPQSDEKKSELYILKRAPCLVLESSYLDVQNYIADFENSDKVAQMYISFLGNTSATQSKMHNIFLEERFDEYLNNEVFYEGGPHLTKSIPVELRKRLLGNMLHMSESDEVIPLMLRIPSLSDTSLYCMNIWNDGRIILLYDFGDKYYIFTAFEPSISAAFIGYINTLRSCGIIRSKEATVDIVKKALGEHN